MEDGESVFRVKICQLLPAKRPNLSTANCGVTKIPNGSLKTELKLQRITGIISPAKAALQQTTLHRGHVSAFRLESLNALSLLDLKESKVRACT